ncbi:hypothetical protein ABN763_18115 [Spongiivirga sp. MCCC 1A20706]|uniref:hypothetical protein n=1 Tax=Spongiivirga sp. MCCC 1A20706 TaxID=3160963 RepID=UPI00397733E0
MKSLQLLMIGILLLSTSVNFAQEATGQLLINGKSKFEIQAETNSAVQLFKEFKTGKYQLGFNFKADDVKPNMYGETIIFFDFVTEVRKDGKLVERIVRSKPIPYFPGEMLVGAESFDFIGVLAGIDSNEKPDFIGTMPAGKYQISLMAVPKGVSGEIEPLEVYFILRRRPTR